MNITVDPNERLMPMEVCVWLKIPLTVFKEQVDGGLWDGTFVIVGNDKRFVARLVEQRQLELADKSGKVAARKRQEQMLQPTKSRRSVAATAN